MSPVGEAHVGMGTGGEELSGPTSHVMAMGQQWWGLVKINRNWRNILHLCIFKAGVECPSCATGSCKCWDKPPPGCPPSTLGGTMLGFDPVLLPPQKNPFLTPSPSLALAEAQEPEGGWLGTHCQWVLSLGWLPRTPRWEHPHGRVLLGQMAASFQSIFLLFACFFSPISGEVTYQKAEKDFFAAALPFLSVWHQHLGQVPKDHV